IYPTAVAGADPDGWPGLWRSAYAGSPFVHVGGPPRLTWAQGTNRCYLALERAEGMPVLFSALDNLGKGGAAQAIQNANLIFGWPADRGLGGVGFGV
ncbi:MAG: N-acetyl-gamma-glutamyl-phosphate reductase, partial [Thermoplasmata archaeon]